MKVKMFVADAACFHNDNTFSLLRGGIDTIWVTPGNPIVFKTSVIAIIESELVESGKHGFEIMLTDEDGLHIGGAITGAVEFPSGGGKAILVAEFHLVLPAIGKYRFYCKIDQQVCDSYGIIAKLVEEHKSTT